LSPEWVRGADHHRVCRRVRRVPGKLELTVSLTRIMFPFLALVAVATALMGMLNSLHRFFVPAMSPAMFKRGNRSSARSASPR